MAAMNLTDAIGTTHHVASEARIVSLVPSITELLCTLGLAPQLVGRTGFCIHPAEVVAGIAKVGGTKDVNIDKIRKLAPTHLIVNIDENEKPTVDLLAQFIPHIVVTHPSTPRDNLALARLMGAIFNASAAAEAWCAQFEQAYAALQAAQAARAAARAEAGRTAAAAASRTVLYCIWQDPWMSVGQGTYIANMLAEIGWQLPTFDSQARYPVFTWSDALVAQIDMVLLSSEPYRFTQQHVDALEKQIGKPVQLVDGEMMSWYGSRAVAGVNYLRELAEG